MLNRDINSRFEDWLISPTETLDFEVKQWLDINNVESPGIIAKALIALENHGGGFLLFGYKEDENKKLIPDTMRPASLEPYLTDAINSIIKKRAEPSFHVEVTIQRHPLNGEDYPLVRVTGQSKVPVRSDSSTPLGSLKKDIYYIRASGPESRGPQNAAEWDALLRRSLANQREEIVSLLRSIFPIANDNLSALEDNENRTLNNFVDASKKRWSSLNDALNKNHPARIEYGYFIFAARIIGKPKKIPLSKIVEVNESARKYTGWPVFVTIHQDETKPKLIDDCIEAWLANVNNPGVGHADFWRIDPKGNFFLLRGFQEDSLDTSKGFGPVGSLFEATLPVWRLGEFLLRILELGMEMFEDEFEVIVECEWHGIANRKLFVFNQRRYIPFVYKVAQNDFYSKGRFSEGVLKNLLADVVKALTQRLYEHFDFFTPPDNFYAEEIAEMTKNRY